MTNWTWSG